jgi:NAD dependent epimerase/dehydratase family enzyme
MKILVAGGSGFIGSHLTVGLLRPQSELLLEGRRAVPEKVQAAGYQLRFGGLTEALEDLLRSH